MGLQEADFGLTSMALDQSNGRFVNDDKLLVRFFLHPRINERKSAEEGRPIYEDTEYAQIMVPGDKHSIVIRPVRESDRTRWPKHYQAFKNREGDVIEGTPLEAWPGITRAQVEELKYFNIRSVEQLADIADVHAQKFMGINMLRKRAQAFLEAASDSAATEKLAAELESRDNQIAALQEAIEDLKARIGDEDED